MSELFSGKKYSVIYADPPWKFNAGKNRNVSNHYQTMAEREIETIPVNRIAEKNSVLLMWTTAPCFPQALKLIEAWGFKYKTIIFTWIKQCKKSEKLFTGMGFYTRSNAEFCILASRGASLPRISRSVHSVIISHVEEHSKKPAEARERIVKLFGDVPRIELFARERVSGWDAWGNEI